MRNELQLPTVPQGITSILRFVRGSFTAFVLVFGIVMLLIIGAIISSTSSTPKDLVRKVVARAAFANSLAWSPDSMRVAVGTTLPPIKIWNAATGDMLASLPEAGANANGLFWSPNGAFIAAASSSTNATLWVWNVADRHLVFSADPKSGASNVAWSPNGQQLAVVVSGRTIDQTGVVHDAAVEVYDTKKWQVQDRIPYRDFVGPIAWSPDSKAIAFATSTSDLSQSTVTIWNLQTGMQRGTSIQHSSYVTSVTWSPDGTMIASSSFDGNVMLFRVGGGSQQTDILVHGGRVNGVAWSPDSKKVASGGEDGLIKIWDITTQKELKSLSHGNSSVKAVGWSPNGLLLASVSSGGDIWLWNTR